MGGYSRQTCLAQAFNADAEYEAYTNLFQSPTPDAMRFIGVHPHKQARFLRALELDPQLNRSSSWYVNAWKWSCVPMAWGQTLLINGFSFTNQTPHLRILEIEPANCRAWICLGQTTLSGEVIVDGVPYTKQACFIHALEIDPDESQAWGLLAMTIRGRGKVTVGEIAYTKQACSVRAMECVTKMMNSANASPS